MSRVGAAALLCMLCACKAELGSDTVDASGPSPDGPIGKQYQDAGIDSPVALGPWGTPATIPGANTAAAEDDVTLSSNKLELYFKRVDSGDANLYVMTRASVTDAWSTPAALTTLNTTVAEESPRLASNDLALYFGRNGDIYKSTRTSLTAPWAAPTALGLNTTAYEKWAAVCPGGYLIVSRATTANGQDMFEGTESAATTALTTLNTASNEQGALLSADCEHLWFQSDRAGSFDIFESTRPSATGAWAAATALADFNTATFNEEDPWISSDQRLFVFASNASGNKDLYSATR